MKFSPIKLFSCLLMAMGLAACQTTPAGSALHDGANLTEPDQRLPDYLAIDCQNIWKIDTATAMNNPLYWQRAIDCAERLSPAEARAEARRWPVQGWAGAYKQGILLANGNVTPIERRQFLDVLDGFSTAYPPAVRPLLQLWRSNQAAQLALSGERSRYVALQQSHDAELDSLRRQQFKLRQSLEDTQHKLERLTDIERQLSSRKASDSSETPHGATDTQSEDQ